MFRKSCGKKKRREEEEIENRKRRKKKTQKMLKLKNRRFGEERIDINNLLKLKERHF